jgi:beta-lactam-binding protein with PASTA domain
MRRFLALFFGGIALVLVAVLSAFLALRVAIHGREVTVPNLAGMSDADAAQAARNLGLNLSVENRFYSSSVAPNHVLSQSPAAGAQVRRGLELRVTESLGGQQVAVPDVVGQSIRPAELILKRAQLELGSVAHLPAPGPADIILAQTPPPNSTGLTGPRVSVLLSGEPAQAASVAYVMPSLLGLTLGAASQRLSTAGLHIASATEPDLAPAPASAASASPEPAPDPAIPPDVPSPPPLSPGAVVVGQSPAPGRRVSRADAIHLVLSRRVLSTQP